MKPPKRRTIPLQMALVHLVDVADLIDSRAAVDGTLAELCDEYEEATQVLTKLRLDSPRATGRIADYEKLVAGLEEELIQRLLNGWTG
jgi:hypothetical protein